MTAVAALVVNWRLPDATLRCVGDLRACGSPLRILVLDNGSLDGSAERLAAELDGAELQVLPENVGYCAAVNRGLAWARLHGAELVLLVNNDVRLPAGFLAPLIDVLRNDPDVACVGPTMLRPDGRVWCEGGRIAFHPNMLELRRAGRMPTPTDQGPVAVDFVPGACALYRLADVDAAGGIDESYFMYWEEVDLGRRLRAAGKKVLTVPWTRVVHDSAASSGGGRSAMRKYMTALNSVRYLKAHGTPRQWAAFLLLDLLLWPLICLGGTGPRAALAKARGIAAGLRGRRVTAADVERLR